MKKKIIGCGSVLLLILCTMLINGIKKSEDKGTLLISEVVTESGSYPDAEGDYSDWIELYYEGKHPLDLTGYYFSDDKNDIFRWVFPEVEILPGEYLVIFASGKNTVMESGEIHTNFKLDSMGESLYLSDGDGKLQCSLEIPALAFDHAYGTLPVKGALEEVACGEFLQGTPKRENDESKLSLTKESTDIVYSMPAGVYAEEVFLDLTTGEQDALIYYTLDGSVPDVDSAVYDGEYLSITDRTWEENRYTSVWSSPYDWDGEGNYSYQCDPVYKATVVKSRLYFPKEDCWSEKVWTNTYLIGAEYTLPIVSLSIEEAALFDEDTGLCVPGDAYEQYLATAAEINPEPRKRIGNYSSDRKVAGYLEYFTEDGSRVMENEITLRVCGNISRGSGMKSFAVYARGDEQTGVFSYPIFGDDCKNLKGETMTRFTSLRLRNFGNDWRRSKFRDALGQSLVSELGLGEQAYQPAIVLINGEYYGLCEIRENRDEQYYEEHFQISQKQLQEVKISDLYDSKETEAENIFMELLSYMESHDLSVSEYAAVVESQFDVKQFLDYVLVQLYLGNLDWHNNNCDFYRSAGKMEDSLHADGRWHVLLYDLDYSINYQTEDHYTLLYEASTHNARILRALLANEEWKSYYISRFQELQTECFGPEQAIEKQQRFERQLESEISEDLSRWDVYLDGQLLKGIGVDYWYEKMEDIKAFFIERPEYAESYFYESLEQFFGGK